MKNSEECYSLEGWEEFCSCGCDAYSNWCGEKEHIKSHFGYPRLNDDDEEIESLDSVYERWLKDYYG